MKIAVVEEKVNTLETDQRHDHKAIRDNSAAAALEIKRVDKSITDMSYDIKLSEKSILDEQKTTKKDINALELRVDALEKHKKFWANVKQMGYLKPFLYGFFGLCAYLYVQHTNGFEAKIAAAMSSVQKQLTIIDDSSKV